MRILQIIQKSQNRGAETFACQLSTHLSNLGHEVLVVSLFEGNSKMPFPGEIICLNASPERKLFDFKTWKRIAILIRDFKPDIIQANSADTLKYTSFSKFIFRWKNPILFRNASEVGKYLRSPIHRLVNKFFYLQVTKVVSVSEASRDDFVKNFSFLKKQTEVIPIGLEKTNVSGEKKLFLSGAKHLIHVGGFTFEKNHIVLIKIFKEVIGKYPNVFLHLVGDGPLREKIKIFVKEQGLNKKVIFHGFMSNPFPLIKSADVLLLPSIIEGLPGVILEAMYLRTPVVAFNVGGISEVVTEKTGELISKGDEEAFKNAVLQTIKNKNEEKIRNAYKLVSQKFMNEQLALEFVKLYKSM